MLTGSAQWPYPVRYGQEVEADFDVLVVGGGIAGCHAAINAARRGARVAVLDKGPVIRSGSGGTGCDHWHGAYLNPCSLPRIPDCRWEVGDRRSQAMATPIMEVTR